LDDVFNAIPLEAGELEDARTMVRIAAQPHAMEVEAEASIVAEVRNPDLCGRGRVVLQQLMPGKRFVLRCLRNSDAESVRDYEAMVR
jgi:hypothetical protein